jgi:hypothetical protein
VSSPPASTASSSSKPHTEVVGDEDLDEDEKAAIAELKRRGG